jgi:hypothetical protein
MPSLEKLGSIILERGGVRLILQAMKAHEKDDFTQLNGCNALANLAVNGEALSLN